MNSSAALFPGQGSQSVGMGAEFCEKSELARTLFQEADKALGFELSSLCFAGPIERLTLTENAQPALLAVGYLCFQEFSSKGFGVTAAVGHSLGEYTALVAAEVLSFEDALLLVHKRGKYMQEAVAEGEGAMLAVMGPTEEEIRGQLEIFDQQAGGGVVQVANLNSPGQTVVAGNNQGIAAFEKQLKEIGAKVIPLKVSAPFHCSLMQPAAEKLAMDLDATNFGEPVIPVYANVSGKKIESGAQAREFLKQQVCASVRWTDCINNLVSEQGIETTIEFGPGGVLSKLMKRINKGPQRLEVFNPESLAVSVQGV